MTTAMFGVPLGFRTFDEDQAKLQQMAAQTGLIKAQTRHQDTLMDLNAAQADQLRAKTAQDELLMRSLANFDRGEQGKASVSPGFMGPLEEGQTHARPMSPEEELTALGQKQIRLGTHLTRAGLLDAGKKAFDAGRQMVEGSARIDANQALTRRRDVQAQGQAAQRAYELFAGVTSPEGYYNAVMTWYNDPVLSQFQLPEGLRQGYNPKTIQETVRASKAAVDLFNARIKDEDLQRKKKLTEEQIANFRDLSQHRQALEELWGARRDRISREGGGGKVPDPKQADYDFARRELKAMGYAFDTPENERTMVYSLMQRAIQMHHQNRAIKDRSEAFALAYKEALEAGQIKPPGAEGPRRLPPQLGGGGIPGTRKPDTVRRPPAGATQIPTDPKARLIPGTTYWDPESGTVGVYDPTAPGKFRGVKKVSSAGATGDQGGLEMASLLGDDDDEDGEDTA